jgi:gluconolactonase
MMQGANPISGQACLPNSVNGAWLLMRNTNEPSQNAVTPVQLRRRKEWVLHTRLIESLPEFTKLVTPQNPVDDARSDALSAPARCGQAARRSQIRNTCRCDPATRGTDKTGNTVAIIWLSDNQQMPSSVSTRASFVALATALALTACAPAPLAATAEATAAPTQVKPTQPPKLSDLVTGSAALVAGDMQFAEGPLWLPDGRLIVSEIQGDKVTMIAADGSRSDFQNPSGKSNGHALDAQGRVLQAEHDGRRVTRIAAYGTETTLAERYDGKRFNSPNDLIVKSDSSIWFTDPDYGLAGRPRELDFEGVYRLDPSGTVTLLTRALDKPNGIAFSPDERTLYVSDSATKRVTAFPVNADNTLGAGRDFGPGCDGIGVDVGGRVWTTSCGKTVAVINPDGVLIGQVDVADSTTNLAWGGADGRTLYVTTATGVYRLTVTVNETGANLKRRVWLTPTTLRRA